MRGGVVRLGAWCWGLALLALPSLTFAKSAKLDFELYDLEDKLFSLKRVRKSSQLVVVEFFSDSCAPCKRALPAWRALHTRYAARGLRLVIVALPATDDHAEARRSIDTFFRQQPVPFPVVWDKYKVVARAYDLVKGQSLQIPRAFLLDKSGRVLLRSIEPDPIVAAVAKRL